MPSGAFALALPALLTWAAASDLRSRRIPNVVSGFITLLWFVYILVDNNSAWISGGLMCASGVFIISFLLWKMHVLGGGDVKLLSAVALWANAALLTPFLLITAVLGGILCVLWLLVRRTRSFMPIALACALFRAGLPTLPGDDRGLPYGVAISLAGLWLSHRLLWS